MSGNGDTLIDQRGVVHEKGWHGQYVPKPGVLGPERDTTWTGRPNARRDGLGKPEQEQDWLGRPVRSTDGEILHRRAGTGGSAAASSASSTAGLLSLVLAAAALGLALTGVVIVTTPIIAPFLLAKAERARARDDLGQLKKWRNWATATSILGLLVVIVIAAATGISVSALAVSLIEGQDLPASESLTYLIAALLGLGSAALSSITGMSPTAMVYLHHKAARFRASGKPAAAARTRLLSWAMGIIAAITVITVLVAVAITVAVGLATLS